MNSITSASPNLPNLAWLRRRLLLFGIAGWGLCVVAGAHHLLRYETTAGPISAAVDRWPTDISLVRDPAKATLVMLVHPNCPCTRASLTELDELMASCGNEVNTYVIFERPPGLVDDPATTDLWRTAAGIHGVTAIRDNGISMASAFHADTSGEVFFYRTDGSLAFSGGITESRGHAGDNDGRTAIEEILQTGHTNRKRTAVFGCSLR